ncbi:MAG: VCBS repeat-containing protein [Planctomycetes bacterium]|nr:VCBS repeat-containing protein [Planctomycetota bacterium]MCB9890497.1 VCBS repeat-containing protein [Planctomycetota bacterium]MCB9917738.1 VCBS repeat-containing protein [Planctomycetota bacterium]
MSRISQCRSRPLATLFFGAFVGAFVAGPLVAQIVPADTRHLFSIPSLTGQQYLGENGLEFVGDLDKDGFDDFAFAQRGDVQVASGRTGELLFALPHGSGIASIQDLDNDGVRDLVRGRNTAGSNGEGEIQLHSGRDGKVLYTWMGTAPNEGLGQFIANLGDVDKDGVEDFGAGSTSGFHVFSGRTKLQIHLFTTHRRGAFAGDVDGDQHDDVLLGDRSAWSAELRSGKTGALIGAPITIPNCQRSCSFPYGMCGGRDVDGDKVPDFVIGNHRPSPNTIRVYSGKTRAVIRTIAIAEGRFGTSLAWIGDLTQDGFPEVVGRIDSSVGVFDVTPAGTGLLFRINGVSGSEFGWSVAGGGDLNADGTPDFLVSSNFPSPPAYVAGYSGKALGLTSDRLTIPCTTGGAQKLTAFTPANQNSNRWWLVLGTTSRTACTKIGSICVPLKPDGYFDVLLANAPALGLIGMQPQFWSIFEAKIQVPPLPASFCGTQLWHSTLLIDLPALTLSTPSEAIGLYLK